MSDSHRDAAASGSLFNWTQAIYGLHAFSLITGIIGAATVVAAFLTGWPSLIAVILNYVKRADVHGTWNAAKDGDDPDRSDTNVVRFFQAYRRHSGTKDFYLAGVGTRLGAVGKALGGVFGLGELPRINEAYDQLCRNWAAGDTIIDIVGFSRGAATTLDFSHCVMERGIRRPGSDTVVERSPRMRFLGVWDIVAAFGLGNLGDDLLNIGHHLSLPKGNLQYCFHAMALDERRPSFLNTRLPGAVEVWFRGVHSDVGGGDGNRGLNDIALKWMMNKAKSAGLPLADEDISILKPNP